jgi:hypothetical protein
MEIDRSATVVQPVLSALVASSLSCFWVYAVLFMYVCMCCCYSAHGSCLAPLSDVGWLAMYN